MHIPSAACLRTTADQDSTGHNMSGKTTPGSSTGLLLAWGWPSYLPHVFSAMLTLNGKTCLICTELYVYMQVLSEESQRVSNMVCWYLRSCYALLWNSCFFPLASLLQKDQVRRLSPFLIPDLRFRCKLCGEDVKITTNTSKYHKLVCKEYRMEEYQRIPDSTNYFCKKCDDAPLKIWPSEKLAETKCSKCRERIVNSGGNLHLCFICDKALCARHLHPTDPSAAVIVDWDLMEGVPDATSDPSASALLVQPSSSYALPAYSPQTTDYHPSAPVHSEIGGRGSTTSYIPRDSVQPPPSFPYSDLPPSYDIAVQDKS